MALFRWFAAVILIATFPAVAAASSLAVQKQMMEPVVLLGNHCSGVIISSEREGGYGPVKTQILTAKHCIRGSDVVTIDIRDNETGALVSTLKQYYDVVRKGSTDLALIELRDKQNMYPTAKIADALEVGLGDKVWCVGFPFTFDKLITEGTFQMVTRGPMREDSNPENQTPNKFIVATAPVAGGNSGGGLFQKNGGGFELIGVTSMSATRAGFPQLSFWVPLEDIQDFLQIKPEPAKSALDLAKELAERIKCEEEAEDDEDKAKCSEEQE